MNRRGAGALSLIFFRLLSAIMGGAASAGKPKAQSEIEFSLIGLFLALRLAEGG